MNRSLHVLAVEPFYGGSHRAFLDDLIRRSRHRWSLVTGKPVHWKWRMRSAPLQLASATTQRLRCGEPIDVIFCSDMLDLPTWRGMLRDQLDTRIPTVAYFHENQWTYPLAPAARVDHHYGYSNLLTAIAADAVWFNSQFARDDFLQASREFVERMPDGQTAHDFQSLQAKMAIVPPGFDPPEPLPPRVPKPDDSVLLIGWVSRWEHDKRPDRFFELLEQFEAAAIDFRLVLAGPRPRQPSQELTRIRDRFGPRIVADRFAGSRQDYWQLLSSIDVVVSTADHEFFGIALCEAVWAGAAPVVPDRLSYPELFHPESRYRDPRQALSIVKRLTDPVDREKACEQNRRRIDKLRSCRLVPEIDKRLEAMKGPFRATLPKTSPQRQQWS